MKPITWLEKLALATTGAAAAFKTLLWSLNVSADSADPTIAILRVIFAGLSFVAFDLVIVAAVLRGWTASGAVVVVVSAIVPAMIALDVAKVWDAPALHATPAITLAVFGLHLMRIRPTETAALATTTAPPAGEPPPPPQAVSTATAAVQVNVAAPAALPATVSAYIVARAAELPQYTPPQLAAVLMTSSDTVRRAMQAAAPATEVIEAERGEE
jgi:hypothetical protein